jgi:hypothetical protein
MNTSKSASLLPGTLALGRTFRIGVIVLGVLAVILLIADGLAATSTIMSTIMSTMSMLVILDVAALVILHGTLRGVPARQRMALNILTPLTAAVVAVVLVVGSADFPQSMSWWILGSFATAAMFAAIALVQ